MGNEKIIKKYYDDMIMKRKNVIDVVKKINGILKHTKIWQRHDNGYYHNAPTIFKNFVNNKKNWISLWIQNKSFGRRKSIDWFNHKKIKKEINYNCLEKIFIENIENIDKKLKKLMKN